MSLVAIYIKYINVLDSECQLVAVMNVTIRLCVFFCVCLSSNVFVCVPTNRVMHGRIAAGATAIQPKSRARAMQTKRNQRAYEQSVDFIEQSHSFTVSNTGNKYTLARLYSNRGRSHRSLRFAMDLCECVCFGVWVCVIIR